MSVKGRKSGGGGGGPLSSFICVCGDLVYERDRPNHTCSGGKGTTSKNSIRATMYHHPPKKESTIVGNDSFVRIKVAKGPNLSEIKRLKTPNWNLSFGSECQLMINLKQRASDGQVIEISTHVIEDGNLPIHTYRFEHANIHYSFEFFM
jgi:hypothetical protein